MCGKNLVSAVFLVLPVGSPPRVREELTEDSAIKLDLRITPACAGRTCPFPPTTDTAQDHPRVCGKNFPHTSKRLLKSGSPPRVREELALPIRHIYSRRITPACAGRTHGCRFKVRTGRDHPRVCGKNPFPGRGYIPRPGSPPRVREELNINLRI